jgi:hypothetical protein
MPMQAAVTVCGPVVFTVADFLNPTLGPPAGGFG